MQNDYAALCRVLADISAGADDLIRREVSLPPENIPCVIAFLDGIVNKELLNAGILTPILQPEPYCAEKSPADIRERLLRRFLCVSEVKTLSDGEEIRAELYTGGIVVLAAGMEGALILRLDGFMRRDPGAPLNDRTVSGPRDSFTESLPGNVGLVRKKLPDPRLRVRKMLCGRRTRTNIALLYVEDIAPPERVREVEARIRKIDIDGILASGYIAQLTERTGGSPFPTYREIERPDIAVAALLEGRIVVLCDHSPLALSFPTIFPELLQAAEDYYEKPTAGTFARLLRWVCFFLAISLPALYVALVSFRPEILPYDLLVTIAGLRSEVPFPVIWETLFIEFAVQIIIESALRLPEPLGQTIGVVSGIIVGQAIISASLATPMVLIVVELANICTFCIPSFSLSVAVRILRLCMVFPAALFGIFGFSLSWMFLLVHMQSLDSMGVPYLAPFAPNVPTDRKDAALRVPLRDMLHRPRSIGCTNSRRARR